MLSTRFIGLACAVAVFVCLMAATVFAQPFDKRTLFSFSAPVALPGVTLPAGQYLFRLADPNSTNKVVQVLNADGTKPYGLFFTIPAERFEPGAAPEVRFIETAAGTPAAIRTWWYPGQRTGYEFIYPKEQARRLAMGGGPPVLTTQAQTTETEQTNTSELSRVGSSGQETQVSATTAPAASTPTGETQEGQIASASISIATPTVPAAASAGGAVAPSQTASTSRARTELPRTASHAPLVAMIGTLALTTAATLRYWRTRRR